MSATPLIEPAPHEFKANLNFADGLAPIFAMDSVLKSGDSYGSHEAEFQYLGESWRVTMWNSESGFLNPGEETHTGTRWDLEDVREYEMKVEAVDDETGQRSLRVNNSPRWDGMKSRDTYGNERSKNLPFTEGFNAFVQGSNIDFQDYLPLLREAANALGMQRQHYQSPHDTSTVKQAEMNVRVLLELSGGIHARDGPLSRMGHLLESDRHGARRIEQRDMDERGEAAPGYRHQVGVDEVRIQEVLPSHSLPKQVKQYQAREHNNLDDESVLKNPKVGAIYYPKLWRDPDGSVGVTPSELAELQAELEEMVLTILHDAGISVTDSAAFVEDSYFEATVTERDRSVVNLPLEDIQQNQESVVISHIADGLSPVQWESLETLVTDGGQVSPQDIADSGGFHRDSVYRALDDMEELVEREYGGVELASMHVAELVHGAVREAKESVREAVEAGSKALEAAERGLGGRDSAFIAWASQYCETWKESDGGIVIDFGEIEATNKKEARREVRQKLREGTHLWEDMKKDVAKWRMGEWRAVLEYQRYPDTTYLNQTITKGIGGKVWKALESG